MVTYSRKILLVFIDFFLVNLSVYTALLLRFEGTIPGQYINIYLQATMLITLCKLVIYYFFGMYTSLWINASVDDLIRILLAITSGTVFEYLVSLAAEMMLPRSVYIISWALTLLLVGGSRLSSRMLRYIKNIYKMNRNGRKRVMIIGAGDAGSMVLKELKTRGAGHYNPVAVIDDDKRKHHASIHGVPIKGGRDKIIETVKKLKIDEIIIAMPSVPRETVSEILEICKQTPCKLKTLPGVYELIDGMVTMEQLREVSIEDLLGREPVRLNTDEIAGYLTGETILVTGGGGSIGSELCRQIAHYNPRKLLIFDIYENNAYDLQNELHRKYGSRLDMEVLIGSIRDRSRLEEIFEKYRPGVVFHAAAHKHVPLMEANPAEAVKNNIFGTYYVAECAHRYNVKRFVLISTDKAVNPTNIMGATKRVAEMVIQAMDKISKTEFVAVRFGNVLGSNGSVIPLFKKQIEEGGPVTVTHPEITRFFMTIPEAVSLVIQAGAMARGGEIFVLDMGKPIKIVDLARDLIRLSGLVPDVDIKIEFSGLRPGEKLYEEIMTEEEGLQATKNKKIFISRPFEIDYHDIMKKLSALEKCLGNREGLICKLAEVVPTYNCPYEEVAAAREILTTGDEETEEGIATETMVIREVRTASGT